MKKKLFLCFSILLFFVSCKEKTTECSLSSNTAIGLKIDELYTQYGKSNDAVYNQPIPDNLFSPSLKKAVENAINASKADIEKVKKSDHPDEKPLIFEGAIFSSLYEGYSRYNIQSIKVNGNTADALVHFEYDMATPKVVWTDTLRLIEDHKQWRIDNITFDSIGNSKDLKGVLTDFAQGSHP
ncbi:DUF3828 domain-containing protein [Chryseobacterium pennipullorum]|uniref:DUF3828 domain-containing protein n=1 Tax=Chryseobacterium pennipullorum TaxID=2258963 RepID=A0A3D9B8P9_9FLAO|nr:DUF3828 domain-containing protein [Chryseobacterium pennipullorum]REC50020.1 hypothetical protein DRF67_00295 [Chryseobacterium pennipullorum]